MLELIRNACKDLISWILTEPSKEDSYGDVKSANVSFPMAGSLSKRSIHSNSSPSTLDEYNYGTNFTVFGAIGGKVIQIRRYDEKNDKSYVDLYIITDDEDFGEALAMIVTRNNLSR